VGRHPPVPLSRFSPRQWVPHAFLNLPGHPGRPKTRGAPAPLVSGELPRCGNGRRHLCWPEKRAEAGRPIPVVHLKSDGPFLTNPSLILAVRLESDGPEPPPPHPAFLSLGPACQSPAPELCPRGPACQPPTPELCPRGPACQPLVPPRARAPARRSNLERRSEIQRPREPDTPFARANFLKRPPVFCKLTRRPWNFAVRSSDLLFNQE
jgi:hypothetical protein